MTSSLLGTGEFRSLLVVRGVYALASSALVTVVAFQVYDITRDPLALGWLGLVEAIPALSLMLFGGHVADRRDRRGIILATTLASAACAVILALLAQAGAASLLAILVVIFLAGTASGFERPALSAFEAQIIPRAEAVRGTSWVSSVSYVGAIAGPAAGGFGIAGLGTPTTYAAIAVLLVIAAFALLRIDRKPMPAIPPEERIVESLLGGVRYVRRSPALLGSMALDLFAVFFGGAIVLLPVFASDILHVGPSGLGLMRAAPSVGALLVMLVAARWPPTRRAGQTLLISVAGFGVSMLVFGLSTSFALSLVALFFSGVTDGISVVIRGAILRVLSPERIRGRVASVNWVFIGASNELGALQSGVFARLFGTVPAVAGGAVVTLGIVALVAAAVPSLRRLDLDTAEPEPEA